MSVGLPVFVGGTHRGQIGVPRRQRTRGGLLNASQQLGARSLAVFSVMRHRTPKIGLAQHTPPAEALTPDFNAPWWRAGRSRRAGAVIGCGGQHSRRDRDRSESGGRPRESRRAGRLRWGSRSWPMRLLAERVRATPTPPAPGRLPERGHHRSEDRLKMSMAALSGTDDRPSETSGGW